jgi:hypothetical protein
LIIDLKLLSYKMVPSKLILQFIFRRNIYFRTLNLHSIEVSYMPYNLKILGSIRLSTTEKETKMPKLCAEQNNYLISHS